MPKWLQGMIAPTLMLWLFAIVIGIETAAARGDSELPTQTELAAGVAYPLVLAGWVIADARKRGRRLCYDYDTFVYCAWPIMVPVYLFQTRGARAFLTLFCFAGICVTGMLAGSVVWLIRELLS